MGRTFVKAKGSVRGTAALERVRCPIAIRAKRSGSAGELERSRVAIMRGIAHAINCRDDSVFRTRSHRSSNFLVEVMVNIFLRKTPPGPVLLLSMLGLTHVGGLRCCNG
jgi:hypothetical protein